MQDVVHGHRRILRHIDQPVVALDGGAVSLGHAAEGAPRTVGFGVGGVDQSFAQPRIPQGRATELLFRPRLRLQSVRRAEGATAGIVRQPQLGSEVFFQRVHIDIFDCLARLPETILSAAALCLAHPYPVGGLITGAHKVGAVHETLQEKRPVVVALLEVHGHLPRRHRQQP